MGSPSNSTQLVSTPSGSFVVNAGKRIQVEAMILLIMKNKVFCIYKLINMHAILICYT